MSNGLSPILNNGNNKKVSARKEVGDAARDETTGL